MDPILEELAEESQGRAVIAKVDVQKSLALAIRYDAADALPTICVFRAGEVIKKAVGFHDLGELRGLLQDQ
jgi:thioredoxin 1